MIGTTAVASDTEMVARAIARVIALKTIAADPGLSKLKGLEQAAARTTIINDMWPMLTEEADAAIEAFGKLA